VKMFLIQDIEQHLVIAKNKNKALNLFLKEFKYGSTDDWLDDVELDEYWLAQLDDDFILTLMFEDRGCETQTVSQWIEELGPGFHISGNYDEDNF